MNVPDLEQEAAGTDTRKVPFDSASAHFRTILADLKVSQTLQAGGTVTNDRLGSAIDRSSTVPLRFFLPRKSSLESAETELEAYERVIVPVDEPASTTGTGILQPAGGSDIVIVVGADGSLSMPLAEPEVRDYTLGEISTYDELVKAL